jgi:hypothetical protein
MICRSMSIIYMDKGVHNQILEVLKTSWDIELSYSCYMGHAN